MEVFLIDGTYELFRHFFALPPAIDETGTDIAAIRGTVHSLLGMMQAGHTHIGVATDHVIRSFRNDLWPGYKTEDGVAPALLAQFPLLEDTLRALGVTVWAMDEFEADDALSSAAALAAADPAVSRVIICTPDKDLAQCVRGDRVVQLDRRQRITRDEPAVLEKFGVLPESIPDYLALVGDTADGYPGLPGWGAKSAAAVLSRFHHLESIPANSQDWHVPVASPRALAETLLREHDRALLFRTLATLRSDLPLFRSVGDLLWHGPTPRFTPIAERFDRAHTPKQPAKSARPARKPGNRKPLSGV